VTTSVGVSAPTAPRVAIVGVRRLRQGLGQHFAHWLAAAGAQVPAFVGRTPESIDEGRRLLLARGIDARGFTSLDALLAAEPVEALVIASPAETHAHWLREALRRNLHVLCEKPLVWGDEEDVLGVHTLSYEFLARRLLLLEHCQWPFTLPAFARLHPGVLDQPLRTFEMELAPSSRGEAMLVDTMSHPFSLVQAVTARHFRWEDVGGPILRAWFSTHRPDADRLEVEAGLFDGNGSRRVAMKVRLTSTADQPRPAAYVVNGQRAERLIRLPDYAMTLADGEREVPLEDPMKLAVADFVRALVEARLPFAERPNRGPDLRRAHEIPVRMRFVAGIVSAFRAGTGN
jgi:GFO/IDH/MocA oxidoreductase family protein